MTLVSAIIGHLERTLAERSRALARFERERAEREQAQEWLHETERALQQSQKMDALGRMAGGVAHDFSNLLTVILSSGEALQDELQNRPSAAADAQAVLDAARRASDLTRQLLTFSCQRPFEPVDFDLNERIHAAEGLLVRLIGHGVELNLELSNERCYVHADPAQIDQVLVNLIVNARDAIADEGTITVATQTWLVGSTHEESSELRPGLYVRLTVNDSGVGIDETILPRVVEPFFTTKDVGKGTGLGLATVYGIVRQSKGELSIDSRAGQGTQVAIVLPSPPRTNTSRDDAAADDRMPARSISDVSLY